MSNNTTTFVLLKGNPTSYSVKQRGLMIEKKGFGLKFAGYYPGQDSIFVEDVTLKNKDLKPHNIPAFEFNPSTNKTELTVPNTDVNLITLLKSHPHFKKRYDIFSEELESEKALGKYNLIEKALNLLKTKDDLELRAMGVVVLGVDAMHYLPNVSLSKLKEKAFKDPSVVISKIEGMDYEAQFISAQAYLQGVVKNNLGHTAVVWGDTENIILPLGTGEIGNEKLGRLLSEKNDQSLSLLQVISQKLNYDSTPAEQSDKNAEIESLKRQIKSSASVESDKDAEIERLKAQLAEANKPKEEQAPIVSGAIEDSEATVSLEDAQAKYFEKFGKEPGPRYKNDLEWILKELK